MLFAFMLVYFQHHLHPHTHRFIRLPALLDCTTPLPLLLPRSYTLLHRLWGALLPFVTQGAPTISLASPHLDYALNRSLRPIAQQCLLRKQQYALAHRLQD